MDIHEGHRVYKHTRKAGKFSYESLDYEQTVKLQCEHHILTSLAIETTPSSIADMTEITPCQHLCSLPLDMLRLADPIARTANLRYRW